MTIDCFMFFNELDLLEIRLNSLAPYVRRFVLCESPTTHSGNPKPLYFDDNKERFKGFNIVHLVCDIRHGTPIQRENCQRNFLTNGLPIVDPEEIILLSDVDEIPDLTDYNGEEGVFKQKLYYYALNVFSNTRHWKGTIAVKRRNIINMQELRDKRNRMTPISGCFGWHFSTMGTPEQIVEKIEAFYHQELNTPDKKAKIAENRANLVDPYNRGDGKFTIEMPSGPEWLLKNKERYKHLFYKFS